MLRIHVPVPEKKTEIEFSRFFLHNHLVFVHKKPKTYMYVSPSFYPVKKIFMFIHAQMFEVTPLSYSALLVRQLCQ